MGKIVETLINRFDGGIRNDRRTKRSNAYAITKHFDVFRFPHKLLPYYATETDESKDKNITRFAIGYYATGSAYRLYGLGKGIVDSDKIAVYRQAGGTSKGWDVPANNESTKDYSGASGLESPAILFEYKDKLYTWADNILLQFTLGGTWNDSYYDAVSVDSVAEPVLHPNDDIAYFFHDNFVSKLDDTSFTAKTLTLPDNLQIKSATPWGNYLAIGCTTKDELLKPKSVVFLWDRDSSLETLSERIDFGEGIIEKLASLDNKLIALMDFHLDDIYGVNRGKVLIKQAVGDKARTINEILVDTAAGGIEANGVVEDNKLYMPMKLPKDGDDRHGIWVVDSFGNASIDYVEEEVETADSAYNGIFRTGNTWWIAHSNDGSLNRTVLLSTTKYGFTSIYESLIFDEKDNSKLKKLIGVSIMNEALPAGSAIVVKYRKDKDTKDGNWTTIFTSNTEDSMEFDAINISGVTFPEYKEIQFRIESTGGAVPTAFKWKSEILDKQKY